MNECERYEEMISALLDGELSADEEAEVRAHMGQCARCKAMYDAFAAVDEAVASQDVPDTLHDGIMAKVQETQKARQTHAKIIRFRSFFAVAACLVVLVGTAFALKNNLAMPRLSASGSAPAAKSAAPAAAPESMLYSADTGVAAAGGATMDAAEAPAPESVEIFQSMMASEGAAPEGSLEAVKNDSVTTSEEKAVDAIGTLYGADEVYPTVMVNDALYEWHKGSAIRFEGLPEQSVFYGEVTHTDSLSPQLNGEFASLFDVSGKIYTIPDDEDVVYLQLTTDWLEDSVVRFDRVN